MQELTHLDAFDGLLNESEEAPVFVYKHSTICSVSAVALRAVESFLADAPAGSPRAYFVKVIESRPISNAIAATLRVPHKSPQLLLVKGRKAVWEASHFAITKEAMRSAVQQEHQSATFGSAVRKAMDETRRV